MDINDVLAQVIERTEKPDRMLYDIATEISKDWKKVYFGAVPYLEALHSLRTIHDSYGYDDAKTIVRYFLANANTWKGETARRIKAELKGMLTGGWCEV